MKKIIFLVPFLIFSCSNKLEPTIIENVNITQKSNDIQVKLIKELTASLDATLEQSQKVSTPTNAEKVANKLFPDILSKAFNKPIKSINYQFQAQAQWTVNKTIQLQLQAQISDKTVTAQAQRQADFKPL